MGSSILKIDTQRQDHDDPNDRLCNLCGLEAQTELHVLLKCPALVSQRDKFYKNTFDKFRIDLNNMNERHKILYMLGNIVKHFQLKHRLEGQMHEVKLYIEEICHAIKTADKQKQKNATANKLFENKHQAPAIPDAPPL